MSGFFIIRSKQTQGTPTYEVVEHNNRSGAEGITIASFSSHEMAEQYIQNYTDKDATTHQNYYQNLQTQTKGKNP